MIDSNQAPKGPRGAARNGTALSAALAIIVGALLATRSSGGPPTLPSYVGMVPAAELLRVPVSGIYPGGTATGLNADMPNPLANDPDAVARGMRDFDAFNCSGCHAANGGGGMGPSLSDDFWIYRSSPANIFLTIMHGRSAGMPAFAAMLPDRTVWELVAYVKSITYKPGRKFGVTTSLAPASPNIEQVSANHEDTATPWQFTEPMPKNGAEPGSPQE